MVGALREPGAANGGDHDPTGLASVQALVARHVTSGLEVRLSSIGDPRGLDTAGDQAAYRILQEALTNAARHGTGRAEVELAFGTASLDLTVVNPASGAGTGRRSGGHGLIGMRERAELLGGSLETDARDGSFRIRARLPYRGPAG